MQTIRANEAQPLFSCEITGPPAAAVRYGAGLGREGTEDYAVNPPSIVRLAPVTKPASDPRTTRHAHKEKSFSCIFLKSEYHYESFSLIIARGAKMASLAHLIRELPNTLPETGIGKHQFAMPETRRSIQSETLFSEGDEVYIQHRGEQYLLRRTRNGKLILTK